MSEAKVKKTRRTRGKKIDAPVMIPLIRVLNPFDPRQQVREELSWAPTKTLNDYFPLTPTSLVVSVNGKIVPQEQFGTTYLDKTDNVVVCPVPAGGDDDGKSILSMVAMIAIAIVAPQLAGAISGAAAGTAAYSIAYAGVMMAGSMLVHAIFAPSQKPQKQDSQTYGIDGAKNTSLEGIPVPVCYGQFRTAGNIVGLYTENDGDTQNLFMLLNAGEGPIASITDIEINDNPITDYNDVHTEIRLGTANQAIIPWFADTIVPVPFSQKLTDEYIHYTTVNEVDKFRVDMVCPGGIGLVNKKQGSVTEYQVPLNIEYRRVGTTEWQAIPPTTEATGWRQVRVTGCVDSNYTFVDGQAYLVSQEGAWTPAPTAALTYAYADTGESVTDERDLAYLATHSNLLTTQFVGDSGSSTTTGRVPTYSGVTRMVGATRNATRKSFDSGILGVEPAKYDIRVRRTHPSENKPSEVMEEVVLTDINEIILDDVTYTNTALLGIKIRLTDQLNGVPKVTFLHGGKIIQVHGPATAGAEDTWHAAASHNPAWITWDILTNTRYGAAMPSARLDFAAFKDWATYCDTKGLTFNAVIDSEMTVWDATQLPLRVGHSQIVNVGTRFTVVTEKASDPVMMFSVANMIEGSYKETWLGTADRANEVDVTFYDKTDKYKSRTIKVYDPAVIAAGAKQKPSTVTLTGVTDHETAYKEGQFLLNLNRYILKTVEFSAPLEAVACSVGDIILVQNDMTDWAVAGRLAAGSTASVLNLDRTVTMDPAKQYAALVMFDAVERATGSVTQVVGQSLFLTGYNGLDTVKRIQIEGRDLRVAETFAQGGGGYGVIVDDATGITAGSAYTLWDTDVLEERPVVNTGGTTDVVTLQSPVTSEPAIFTNWMFGETTKVKQPFRVKAISGSHEYKRDITALQYDATVYDFGRYGTNVPLPGASSGTLAIGQVRDLQAYEDTYVSGEQIITRVVIGWRIPAVGNYGGADVYVRRRPGDPFELVSSTSFRTTASVSAERGDEVTIRVVAYDVFGHRVSADAAPTTSLLVRAEVPDLEVGNVTGADLYWSGRDCKISWRYNATTHSYEFGSEPVGADAGALDPQFKDYEIRVYDAEKTALRRTEYTAENSYTYTYDKNHADGLARRVVFEIRMRDVFNNLGDPVELEAYNPPPTINALSAAPSFESATISYAHDNAADFAGAQVWLSTVAGDLDNLETASAAFKVYEGPDTSVPCMGLAANTDYFYRLAPYDVFGTTELTPTPVNTFKTTFLDVAAIAEGSLSGSLLVPELRNTIDLITAPATTVGSVAAQVLAEATARGTAITNLETVVQQGDAQLASQITTVSATVADNTAAIQTEATTRATETGALSSQLTVVAAQTGTNTAAIQNEVTARTDAIAAEVLQRNEQIATYDANVRTWVQGYTYSKATSDSAISEVYDTLRSEFASAAGVSEAWVTNYTYSKAAADEAIATQVSQVSSRLNNIDGTSSGVTIEQKFATQANRLLGLEGQYTVKIETDTATGQPYVTGFGLASTAVDGVPTSEFVVNADRFAITLPSYPTARPFTIGTVNGVPGRVMIDSALIGDANINTLKIRGNAVSIPTTQSAINEIAINGEDWNTVQELWMDFGTDAPQVVIAQTTVNLLAQSGGSDSSIFMRILQDTEPSVIAAISVANGFSTSFPFAVSFAGTTGLHKYTVQIRKIGSTAYVAGPRNLTLFGALR